MANRFQFSILRMLTLTVCLSGAAWALRMAVVEHYPLWLLGICPCGGLAIGVALGRSRERVVVGAVAGTLVIFAILLNYLAG